MMEVLTWLAQVKQVLGHLEGIDAGQGVNIRLAGVRR